MKNCLHHCCVTVSGESGVPADALRAAFRLHEKDELLRGLPPMAGIPETLAALHDAGVKHYVATHRDLVSRELLDKAGLLHYFSGFVTEEDKLPRKPAPDMLLHLMEKYCLRPEECVMIGDRPLDTESGMEAGVTGILIDPEGRFPEGKCDLRVRSAAELIPLMS